MDVKKETKPYYIIEIDEYEKEQLLIVLTWFYNMAVDGGTNIEVREEETTLARKLMGRLKAQ